MLRAILPPSIVVHWGGHGADLSDALHILVPEGGNDSVVALLTRWRNELDNLASAGVLTDWTTTRVPLPNDELLRHQGLEMLFHHVLRCRPARPSNDPAGLGVPLDNNL